MPADHLTRLKGKPTENLSYVKPGDMITRVVSGSKDQEDQYLHFFWGQTSGHLFLRRAGKQVAWFEVDFTGLQQDMCR